MGSKSNTFENQLLLHIFNNAAITLIGDAAGVLPSAGAGDLYVSLHVTTALVEGTAVDQTSNEISYTGYTRQAVPRTAGGWTVVANAVSNTAEVLFGEMTAGTGGTVVSFGIGTDISGTGKLLYWGDATPNIAVTNGVTPRFAIGDVDVTED